MKITVRVYFFVKLREENKRSSIAVSIPAGRPCLRLLLPFLRDFQARLDNKTRFPSDNYHRNSLIIKKNFLNDPNKLQGVSKKR